MAHIVKNIMVGGEALGSIPLWQKKFSVERERSKRS